MTWYDKWAQLKDDEHEIKPTRGSRSLAVSRSSLHHFVRFPSVVCRSTTTVTAEAWSPVAFLTTPAVNGGTWPRYPTWDNHSFPTPLNIWSATGSRKGEGKKNQPDASRLTSTWGVVWCKLDLCIFYRPRGRVVVYEVG